MFPQIIDSVVLDVLQAAGADASLAKGIVSFTGLGTTIPLRKTLKRNSYINTPYAAGTPKQMTWTIGNTPEVTTAYTLTLQKFPVTPEGIQQANGLYDGLEKYTFITDATPTVTELAHGFSLAIIAAATAGQSAFTTASLNAAGVLTVVAGSANFDFLISMDTNLNSAGAVLGVGAVTVPLVKTSGTYAQVVKINPNAVAGTQYTTLTYRWYNDNGDNVLQKGQNQQSCEEVLVFVNESQAGTDFADFITVVDDYAAGTATASKYLGF